MDAPLKLVAPPTAEEVKRRDVIEFLRARLQEAEAGEIDEACLIVRRPDGKWRYDYTPLESIVEWIGRLETMKVALMDRNDEESHAQ